MPPRNPDRARRPVFEIVLGTAISVVALVALGALLVPVVMGQLDLDPRLILGLAVGVIVVVSLVIGAVRFVLRAVATPIRPVASGDKKDAANRSAHNPTP